VKLVKIPVAIPVAIPVRSPIMIASEVPDIFINDTQKATITIATTAMIDQTNKGRKSHLLS
jgi:hypothetical protein